MVDLYVLGITENGSAAPPPIFETVICAYGDSRPFALKSRRSIYHVVDSMGNIPSENAVTRRSNGSVSIPEFIRRRISLRIPRNIDFASIYDHSHEEKILSPRLQFS